MGLLDRREMRRKARAIFKRLTVDIDLDCPVEQLSVAQQQFVEIAKALSLDARILVLDEPTATLTPGEAEHLFSIMHDLKLLGVGMVFISHHLDEIFTICDQITVLRDGAYIQTLPAAETNVEELVKPDGRAQNREYLPGEIASGRHLGAGAGGDGSAHKTCDGKQLPSV